MGGLFHVQERFLDRIGAARVFHALASFAGIARVPWNPVSRFLQP